MIQLWLRGNRIDSINMLRECFAVRKEEELLAVCRELCEKLSDGFLVRWLENYPETRCRANIFEQQRDNARGILVLDRECRILAEYCTNTAAQTSEHKMLPENVLNALAVICGIKADVLKKSCLCLQEEKSCLPRTKIFELLKNQAWYRDDERIKHSLQGIREEYMAINSTTLKTIIAESAIQDTGRSVTDLYLLNVDKPFSIGNLDNLSNLRFVGYGNPVVHFDSCLRGETLDMEKKNIKFQGIRLNVQGVTLANSEKRLNKVERI